MLNKDSCFIATPPITVLSWLLHSYTINFYQKVLKDIKDAAENGDLSVEAYNDETILNLLIKDGFTIEGTHLKDTVKVKW